MTPLTIITAQPAGLGKLAFPSKKTGDAIARWSRAVAVIERDSRVTFILHDLHRSCRTLMSRLGVELDIAELAVGHKRKGRATPLGGLRQALRPRANGNKLTIGAADQENP